jgi:DHA1 family multidrug resistance protein-like MFS transporter
MRLYLISAITDFVQALFIFTATRYLAEQQPGSMSLGVLGACNFLSYALSSAVSGHVSDRFGRRRLIASGSVVFAASFVVALQSLDPPLVYVATMLSGAAAGMIFPPVIAMITAGQVH